MGLEWRQNNPKPVHWFAYNDEKDPPRVSIQSATPGFEADHSQITFTIPRQTPAGYYLMRMDQIWPARTGSTYGAQLYPSCAQIRIESDSTSLLPSGILIPRDLGINSTGMNTESLVFLWLVNNSLGMHYSQAMSDMKQLDKDWHYPGGPLWNGEDLVEDMPVCPLSDPMECQAKK
jgi:hypothetical protein